MAQLIKKQAICGIFMAGEKSRDFRIGYGSIRPNRLAFMRNGGLRMPIVHHTVPLAQTLRPQQ